MPDTRDPQSVVDAAEQAAAVGDYATAERLLREAAQLQEATLGPHHPDLANTLNNLGVVCEMTAHPADAERYFRRACAIATAVLEPDHPFVATSRKNLEDFCASRGQRVDPPVPSSVAGERDASVAREPDAPVAGSDDPPVERASCAESRPAASRRWSRPLAIGVLVAGGLTLIATVAWFRSDDAGSSSVGSASVAVGSGETTAGSPPVGPMAPNAPEQAGIETAGLPAANSTTVGTASTTTPADPIVSSRAQPTPAGRSQHPAVSAPDEPVVAAARLCRELSTSGGEWQCAPPRLPAEPGTIFFYTRLKSATGTTVQHRWYRGERLRQTVELSIGANTTRGYRTYSRNTVEAQGAGDWRVELRTREGAVLHEERFVVR